MYTTRFFVVVFVAVVSFLRQDVQSSIFVRVDVPGMYDWCVCIFEVIMFLISKWYGTMLFPCSLAVPDTY